MFKTKFALITVIATFFLAGCAGVKPETVSDFRAETPSVNNHNWQEQGGVVYLKVTSDGTTGPEWVKRLDKKGFRVGDYAKTVLLSEEFKPTRGVATEIIIIKGTAYNDFDRSTYNIRDIAKRGMLKTPNMEVACLIRENFSDADIKAMGLIWIVVMHEPIKDSGRDQILLGLDRDDDGHWLRTYCGMYGRRWNSGYGFAFVVSTVGSQN